ncbi:MAG: right-handed parallel beta-helix repeat-containing protein, partial [Candidatus Odinarchaeota archaeon]|nr:right-handed parallel beta-helix repeat-containing protein [Candidatus Odinarchaeota archaeon]
MSSKFSKFRKDAKYYIVAAILIFSSLLLSSVFYRIFICKIPSLPIPPSEPIAPTPGPSDYIINRTVIFENCTIVFNSSLFIEKGGALILKNATLYFRTQGDDDLREIIVYAGGNLTIIDSWIAGYAYRKSYYIVVYKGAKFLMRNSTISYAGGEGVWIGTDNVIISGSKFQFCNGLFIENAENVTLYNNIFSNDEYGVHVFNVSNIMIFNNTINRISLEGIVVAG